MSVNATIQKLTIADFAARKGGDKIVMLTAYSAPVAKLLAPHVDALLVGDSVGMVYHGLPSTVGVTLDMMILHTAAARRGAPDALLVADLPAGTYETSPQQAYESASRLVKECGADAVKLEGGVAMAETVRHLVSKGIPVMGHIGLMPQKVDEMGGYKIQGRDEENIRKTKEDAQAIAEAGAFAIVIEGVIEPVSAAITQEISIPTIGIGASPCCDGQILVSDDLFGLFTDFKPKFVRRYAGIANDITEAAEKYAADVRSGAFPSEKECFN
jgi:3-methyl-2-oxobutanoate hydroxymethyltransferase